MTQWQIQGSRVYGNGKSYNCHNKITAQELHHTLTTYETTKQSIRETEQRFEKITQQLTQIQMSIKIIEHEIQELVKQ